MKFIYPCSSVYGRIFHRLKYFLNLVIIFVKKNTSIYNPVKHLESNGFYNTRFLFKTGLKCEMKKRIGYSNVLNGANIS